MPVLACLFAAALGFAPSDRPDLRPAALQVVSEGPAVQLGALQLVVHSRSVGRDFLVKITPPFAPVPAGEKRPVIFALDGGYEVAGPIGWVLGGAGGMQQAWVVSVGYQPADYHWRDTDLAHVPMLEKSGRESPAGGEAFEAFLTHELAPFIESRFAADPAHRVLLGHSRGGLFAATVFAEHPNAFSGYIIGSADIRHQPDVLQAVAAAAPKASGVRVYLAAGGAEQPAVIQDEKALLSALGGPDSQALVTSQIYPAASHLSYYPRLVTDGFAWVLPAGKSR